MINDTKNDKMKISIRFQYMIEEQKKCPGGKMRLEQGVKSMSEMKVRTKKGIKDYM